MTLDDYGPGAFKEPRNVGYMRERERQSVRRHREPSRVVLIAWDQLRRRNRWRKVAPSYRMKVRVDAMNRCPWLSWVGS